MKPIAMAVGLLGARREQDHDDRGEGNRVGAIRPCGDDPEQLGDADHDESAPGIDQRRQPVGDAQAATAAARSAGRPGSATSRASASAHAQCRPVLRPPDRRAAAATASPPAGRSACAPPPRTPGAGAPDRAIQPAAWSSPGARREIAPAPLPARRSASCCASFPPRSRQNSRHRAPAGEGCEQTVHRFLQHRRVVAELRGFAERLVDHRVERDDPADEFAPDRLGVLEFGSGDRQCAGEPAGDLGRDRGEQARQPAPRAAEIGSGENDAGADDADADLAGPGRRQA